MLNVKISCACGQNYSFDVDLANGQLRPGVACPACGADGTAAANAIIASKLSPPEPPAPVHATLAPPSPAGSLFPGVRVDSRALGLVGRETAEVEARAKISWGDSKEDVIKYLMLQGFSGSEASDLVEVLFEERLAALRAKGLKRAAKGGGMICVSFVAWTFFHQLGIIRLKLMGLAIGIGLWGFWLLITGLFMVVLPKMESGDVASD